MRMRERSQVILAIIFGKAVALAVAAGKEAGPARAYPTQPDYYQQTVQTLPDQATGTLGHSTGFGESGGFDWRVYGYTDKNPATNNKIGARDIGYDRCNPTDPWTQSMDTGWTYAYSGARNVTNPPKYGIFANCGQTQQHQYRNTSSHLFTNNNPTMNTTQNYTTYPGG